MWRQVCLAVAMALMAVERSAALQMQAPSGEEEAGLDRDAACDSTCKSAGMETLKAKAAKEAKAKGATAKGDPHLKNLNGESFDVLRSGIATLLGYPRTETTGLHQSDKLRVEASVEHPGNATACKGFFILRLWITGSLLGEDIEVMTQGTNLLNEATLGVKIGNKTMRSSAEIGAFVTNGQYRMIFTDERDHMAPRHPFNRLKFASMTIQVAGVALEVNWFTGKRLSNRLDFSAQHLSKLGEDWGGILGADDHLWVSSFDPTCRKSHDYGGISQLTMNEPDQPWQATASLD